eukprot:COSAG01_NODE_19157_length_1027_cov_1.514009_2_plen_94_part_01
MSPADAVGLCGGPRCVCLQSQLHAGEWAAGLAALAQWAEPDHAPEDATDVTRATAVRGGCMCRPAKLCSARLQSARRRGSRHAAAVASFLAAGL